MKTPSRRAVRVVSLAVGFLLSAGVTFVEAQSVRLIASEFPAGAGRSSGDTHHVNSTIGQPTVTPVAGREFQIYSGFFDIARRGDQHVVVQALTAPILLEPIDGTSDVANEVKLVWQKSELAEAYRIQVAFEASFDVLGVDQTGIRETVFTVTGLPAGESFFWRVAAVGSDGEELFSPPFKFSTLAPVSNEAEEMPADFALFANYPNPFNPSTTIVFDLPKTVHTRMIVYDATGRVVSTLVDAVLSAGHHRVTFDAHRMAGGTYFYQIVAGAWRQTRRMVLLK